MSGRDTTSGERLPLDQWLARYDAALLRGEPPPDLAEIEDSGADRLRAFLDALGRTLGPHGPGPDTRAIEGDDTEVDGRPEKIGRFLIEEELGRGGFGIVYRALDPEMGRRVALKVPRAGALTEPGVRRRFLREAQAAAQLDHPNLVPVFEVGEDGRVCYIASAYCEGPTLRRWIGDGLAPTDPRAVARLVLALARAVEHMHARGLLHCDLKPGNVLIDPPLPGDPDGEPTPRVTDFGLARLADAPLGDSTAARPWGTPPYMAPEQIEMRRDSIGPATDVYALGAMLYELLTGRQPHRGATSWELMRAVVYEPPPPPRSVRRAIPRDLAAIATKCLEKRPDRRYRDATALADDLSRFLDRRPTRARPLGRARRLGRWSARNPAAAALLVLGAATLVVSLSYSLALRRAVDDLNRANLEARAARGLAERQEARASEALAREKAKAEAERASNYVAVLILAQQELERGQPIQAQRYLRGLLQEPDEPDLRDFAWYYLLRQSRRECTLLDELAMGGLRSLAAGDGQMLATSSTRGDARWSVERPETAEVPAPARPMFRFEGPIPIPRRCLRVALLAGGRAALAYSEEEGDPRITVFDPSTGEIRQEIERSRLRFSTIAESADGNRLVVGISSARDPKLTVMGWGVGEREVRLLGVPAAYDLAVSSADRIVALRRVGPTVNHRVLEFWHVFKGRRMVAIEEPVGPALAASPAPGGPIATGTLGGVVQIREPIEGDILYTLPAPQRDRDHVACLAFAPDGKTLAAGYNGLAILWDVEGRREIARIDGLTEWTTSIAFLGGSTRDIVVGLSGGEVIVWHLEPIEPAVALRVHEDEVWGVGYVDGGRTLATLGGDGLLKLWDVATGGERAALAGHEAWPSCLATSASGGLAATGDYGGDVFVWDVGGERRLHHLRKAHEGRVRAVALSPDGKWLASGGQDPRARLWDAATGAPAGEFDGHEKVVRALAFRPDGRALASADEAGEVILWDVESRRETRRLEASAGLVCLAWSPDGEALATGDKLGSVTLWDPESGEARPPLSRLHRREVSSLAFSPDGRILAVACQDRSITLVDVATGRRHLTLAGHEGGVNALAFSPNGRVLASAGHDRTVRLWWAGPEMRPALPSSSSGL